MTPEASAFVSLSIPALTLVVLSFVALAVRRAPGLGPRAGRRFVTGAAAWLALTGALALSGALARFDATPPPLFWLFLPVLTLPLVLGLSRFGRVLAEQTPLVALVGLHGFRFPLELAMHQAALEGTMPVQMSFSGYNLDVLTGLGGVLVALALWRGRAPLWLVAGWNVMGTFLLVVILTIAVASLPVFHAFGSEPEKLNTWVAYFPFIWLPAGLVPVAIFGHVLVFRRVVRARADGTRWGGLASGTGGRGAQSARSPASACLAAP